MNEQTTDKTDTTAKTKSDSQGWLGSVPYIIAVGALIAYGFFIYFLLGKVDADEREWSRSLLLFSGVEAIVFAAAGFLFGREVNRKRAQNAEEAKKLAEKQKEAAKKQEVEERKNALILGAMAIQSERMSSQATDQRTALEGMAPKENPLGSIAETARKMYPELLEK